MVNIGPQHFNLFLHFQNEIICASLDRIPFYILPLKYQKELIHLMHRMQNGVVIRIGPLAELDYEMASTVSELLM